MPKYCSMVAVYCSVILRSLSTYWQPSAGVVQDAALEVILHVTLQGILSYPFFDPVLTDRAFLASPGAMLISFLLAGLVSGTFILLFSFMGIFGNMTAILRPQRYTLPTCSPAVM